MNSVYVEKFISNTVNNANVTSVTFTYDARNHRNTVAFEKWVLSQIRLFLVVFSFFEKTTYCCRTRRLSVRLSVRPSVRPSVRLSVRPSVEIIFFRCNSLPNRPIELKIGLNVREGVVHVRKAWFFEILIASCKFMQFAIFCK